VPLLWFRPRGGLLLKLGKLPGENVQAPLLTTRRALITGIAGFAGGFLAEHLLEYGDEVLGCSRDGQWGDRSATSLLGRVELVSWDLAAKEKGDSPHLCEAPCGPFRQMGTVPFFPQASTLTDDARRRIADFRPTCIYHLAAISVPQDCGQEEVLPRAMAVNVGGTRQVLDLAATLVPSPRVLFISTSHVYAPVRPASSRVDEEAPLAPRSAYGHTKLAAEEEVRRAVREQGCDALIVRAFLHTGPRQIPALMLPQWARQFALGGQGPVAVHTRDARIDLSDVRDVVRAYRLLAERGQRSEVYNVGSSICRTSGEVLDMLRRLAGPERPIVETMPGQKQDPIADVSRLIQCTGWHATIPLEKTVADTWEWWRREMEGG
jgi:GDP-4-dehydro-6-deoxy-D-mannose reductase